MYAINNQDKIVVEEVYKGVTISIEFEMGENSNKFYYRSEVKLYLKTEDVTKKYVGVKTHVDFEDIENIKKFIDTYRFY